jgi:DNA-binding transcriptional LysR family regulator
LPAGDLGPGARAVLGRGGGQRDVTADQGGQRRLRLEVRRVGQDLFPQCANGGAAGRLAARRDLALIGASGAPPSGLSALPIISERLVAALPPGHPLAGRRRVTLADITPYPLVCLPAGTGIRTVLDQACAAQGLQPDIALQASAPGAVADLASRGLGIAILSESMAASHPQLKSLVIDDIQTPAVLALIWAETDSPALRELLEHSRRAFMSPPHPVAES